MEQDKLFEYRRYLNLLPPEALPPPETPAPLEPPLPCEVEAPLETKDLVAAPAAPPVEKRSRKRPTPIYEEEPPPFPDEERYLMGAYRRRKGLTTPIEDLSALPYDERHRRKCQICRHPERKLIEEDFILWRKPIKIVDEYNISEISIYRHAHAMGLFTARRENMRLAIDRIIEVGAHVEHTGETIIRAVRAQACLTDDGRWVEPARRLIVTQESPVLIDSSTIRNGT